MAGGVGATFAVPLYRSVRFGTAGTRRKGVEVRFVWAVRDRAEAGWGVEELGRGGDGSGDVGFEGVKGLVEVFVTRSSREVDDVPGSKAIKRGSVSQVGDEAETVELMDRRSEIDRMSEERKDGDEPGIVFKSGRPHLEGFVEELFQAAGSDGRVAVLVCGPGDMARDLRKSVGKWVRRGRRVFWHAEVFGL